MRTAACFLVMVLVATVTASSSTLQPTGALVNDFPASLGDGLSRYAGKRGRFPGPAGLGKEVSSPSTATATATAVDDDSKIEMTEEFRKKGQKYKICLNHGHCYKKKLVCPKKCSNKKSPDLLGSNNFGGHCIFNCKKCIAHC